MPPISMKKIFIAILIIFALSRLDRIIHLAHQIYTFFCDWLAPLNDTPPPGRVALAALLLALLYISVYKLLYEKIRKK